MDLTSPPNLPHPHTEHNKNIILRIQGDNIYGKQ